jgi:RNA polymerase sigma-70 factor (ECF subfamily)
MKEGADQAACAPSQARGRTKSAHWKQLLKFRAGDAERRPPGDLCTRALGDLCAVVIRTEALPFGRQHLKKVIADAGKSGVTFLPARSYIVRAKMAIRRPARKGSRSKSGPPQKAGPTKKSAERVPGVAGQVPDEGKLVEAAQRDPKEFDALYELHFERVYAFVTSRVRNRTTAEDVTSDVFHKALANLRSYEWRGVPFLAWLLRIAANAIVDQAKRAAREFPAPDDPPEMPANPDLQASEMRAVEHRAQLFRLVGQLPEVQKQVVYQRFVEQRSIQEIAQKMGKTAGAIKQLQLRAMQNLRAQMGGVRG